MIKRRPTSFDIAEIAGVSQPTVSRALSGNPAVRPETRARIVAAAEQLHYKVDKNASGLRRQHSRTLALLFFEESAAEDSVINPFYLSMLGPMVRSCANRGYDLLISFQQLSGDWHVDFEDSHKADGIILLGYGDYREQRPKLDQLVRKGAHFVRWGSARSGVGITVGSDNEQGGFVATDHLLEQGRTAIAFIGTADSANPEFLQRWTGYCRALRARGIEPDRRLRADADASEASGRAAVADLIGRDVAFDAIFAASDIAAIAAMHMLQERGRSVPRDVAVVGFDDIAAAGMSTPRLTTVRQDARRAGETLIEALIGAIENGEPSDRLLPTCLVVRESSGG